MVLMHLSMSQGGGGRCTTHGKLTLRAFPWVGILTFGFCPGVGNLTVLVKKMVPREVFSLTFSSAGKEQFLTGIF